MALRYDSDVAIELQRIRILIISCVPYNLKKSCQITLLGLHQMHSRIAFSAFRVI